MGFGQWNGAPAIEGSYRSLTGEISLYCCGDGGTFPAKGVLGGHAAVHSGSWRRFADGTSERLPDFFGGPIADGEAVGYRSCAGGGYGPPEKREPQRVVEDVNRKWLSVKAAADIFGVELKLGENVIDYVVDQAATDRLRGESRCSGQ